MSTSKRGFATLTLERRREVSSMGGKAVAPEKRMYARDRDLASSAGRKGGKAAHVPRTSSFPYAADRILTFLRANPVGYWTAGKIADHVGVQLGYTYTLLRQLRARSLVEAHRADGRLGHRIRSGVTP